jgi:AGZA family xanthine/uracil permease-like MFS transporter
MGNLRDPHTALAIFGLLVMAALLAWRVRAAILVGVIGTTIAGALAGLVHWQPQTYGLADIGATALQLDIRSAMRLGLVEIVFAFLFVDLFDNVGTLVAVGQKAGLFDRAHQIPRINRILLADATATIAGSLAGTSTVVSYIESSAGVAAGGRSGVTTIVTGLLFIAALWLAPLVGAIPAAATAPALIVVGSMMMTTITEISWSDPTGGDSGISDHDDDSANVQHCQWPRVRVLRLHAAQRAARARARGELAGVRAYGVVYCAVRLSGTGRMSTAMLPAEWPNRGGFAYSAPCGVK